MRKVYFLKIIYVPIHVFIVHTYMCSKKYYMIYGQNVIKITAYSVNLLVLIIQNLLNVIFDNLPIKITQIL